MLGTCVAVGSTLTEPLPQFLAMVSSRQGEAVRQALKSRWLINVVPGASQLTTAQLFTEWISSPSTPQAYKDLYVKNAYTLDQWYKLKLFADYADNRIRGQRTSPSEMMDRVIATYLMYSQSTWEGRPDIEVDVECLDATVRQMAPLSTFTGVDPAPGFSWWWLALGAAVLGSAGYLIYRRRKDKKGAPA